MNVEEVILLCLASLYNQNFFVDETLQSPTFLQYLNL